jgi:ribosomal protein L11 methyltransferase
VSAVPRSQWTWTRPIPPRWADAWLERTAFVGLDRLAIVEKPGLKLARLEAYPATEAVGRKLVKHFGGRLRKVAAAAWLKKAEPAAPIRFGKKLVVTGKKPAKGEDFGGAAVLVIPAGLAFGTGQHATTGMMLRELAGLKDWAGARVLDAGTGSGILALAARALGAPEVEAFDYDAIALRTARENEKRNFRRPAIDWQERDVLKWKSRARFTLITANLFSELLVKRAAVLAQALRPGGLLLVSGVLATQTPAVRRALAAAGLAEEQWKRRGKWTMARYRRPLPAPRKRAAK